MQVQNSKCPLICHTMCMHGTEKVYHGEFIKLLNHIIHPLEYPFDLQFKYFNAKMNMIMTDFLFINHLSNKSIMLCALLLQEIPIHGHVEKSL